MKEIFKEFYSEYKIDFNKLQDDTVVVFDTNSLLNIYRYSQNTSNKFIEAIKKINKNIWIPYQVGLEFNLNRKKIMKELQDAPLDFQNNIESNLNKFKNQVTNLINQYVIKSTDAKGIKSTLVKQLEESCANFTETFVLKQTKELLNLVNTDTDYLDSLVDLLNGKVGCSYDQKRIDEIVAEGKNRYLLEIPPGYEDIKDKQGKYRSFNGITYPLEYGDLIFWYQILDKAKEEHIKKVVLITDDNKPDWWYFIDKQNNLGPRAELKNEIIRYSNAELIMINSNSFIQQIEETERDIVEEPFFVVDYSKAEKEKSYLNDFQLNLNYEENLKKSLDALELYIETYYRNHELEYQQIPNSVASDLYEIKEMKGILNLYNKIDEELAKKASISLAKKLSDLESKYLLK